MAAVGFRYWRGSNVVMDSYLIMSPDASTSFDLCLDINSVEQLPTDNLLLYIPTLLLYRRIPRSTEKEKREKKERKGGGEKEKKFSKVVGAKDLFTVPRKRKKNKKKKREKKRERVEEYKERSRFTGSCVPLRRNPS